MLVDGIKSALTADGLLVALEAPRATQQPSPSAADGSAPRRPDDPATTGFPHMMIGREIASRFERHRTIEATVGPQRMTMVLELDS